MSTETIHVKIPAEDRQRCRDAGLNISGTCRRAIREMLEKVEPKGTGATAAKQVSPAAVTCKGEAHEG